MVKFEGRLGRPDEEDMEVECVSEEPLGLGTPEDGETAVVDGWDLLVFGDATEVAVCAEVLVGGARALSDDCAELAVDTADVVVLDPDELSKQLLLGPCPTMKGWL